MNMFAHATSANLAMCLSNKRLYPHLFPGGGILFAYKKGAISKWRFQLDNHKYIDAIISLNTIHCAIFY